MLLTVIPEMVAFRLPKYRKHIRLRHILSFLSPTINAFSAEIRALVIGTALGAVAFAQVLRAETVDPDFDGHQYGYSENAGWLNAEPLGNCGPGMHVTASNISGWLWSESVGWISLSCENTSSCNEANYGLTITEVDSDLHQIAGFAWAENIGWINFSCATSDQCGSVDYGVHMSGDGLLTGFAWSENVGWISVDCSSTDSCATVDYGVHHEAISITDGLFGDSFEGC